MPDIKFCGLTRRQDVQFAATLGTRFVGVIFAESPRRVTVDAARQVLTDVPAAVTRVGVFGPDGADSIAEQAAAVGVDVVQMHGDPDPKAVSDLRRHWKGQVWASLRIQGIVLPEHAEGLFETADAVVLDALVGRQLGGTGVTLRWEELQQRVAPLRTLRAKLVLAGGLRPANVARAIAALQPDVVDVSSGVESKTGVKDHDKMKAFHDAVAGGSQQ